MHCKDASSSFSLTAEFLADGVELCEYEPTVNDRHMQCWVPVATGQVISVNCDLDMAGIAHHVDFLVDGIIRDTWISKKNQHSANLTFEEVFFRQGRNLVSGTMKLSSTGAAMSLISCVGLIASDRVYRRKQRQQYDHTGLHRDSSIQGRFHGFDSFAHLPRP